MLIYLSYQLVTIASNHHNGPVVISGARDPTVLGVVREVEVRHVEVTCCAHLRGWIGSTIESRGRGQS